jgi:hypothetical protein
MRIDTKNICGALFVFAVILTSQSISPDKPAERGIRGASMSDALERSEKRRDWPMKKLFKDMRPGACKTTTRNVPGSSWPARGEAAVSLCRP